MLAATMTVDAAIEPTTRAQLGIHLESGRVLVHHPVSGWMVVREDTLQIVAPFGGRLYSVAEPVQAFALPSKWRGRPFPKRWLVEESPDRWVEAETLDQVRRQRRPLHVSG